MVRWGSRASLRNTAVASKPRNDAIANMIAMPSEPDTTCDGWTSAVDRPSAEPPPRPMTTTSSTSTIATSAISSVPRTRLDSSMCR